MKRFKHRAITLALSSTMAGGAFADNPLDGILDTSFAGGGISMIHFDEDETVPFDKAHDVVVDSAGRTYVVGTVQTPNGERIGIARLDKDGLLDMSYGPDGLGRVVLHDVEGSEFNMSGTSAALDQTGALLVAGTVKDISNDFYVCRIDESGNPTDFSGISFPCRSVSFDLGGPNADVLRDIVVQPDGKIVLVGHATASVNPLIVHGAIARLHPDGNLDSTFGNYGKFSFLPSHPTNTKVVQLTAAAVQDNGKIVVACHYKYSTFKDYDLCAVRFNSAGQNPLDTTFYIDGFKGYSTFDLHRNAESNAIALVPRSHPQLLLDQSFVIAGRIESGQNTGVYDGLIARISPNNGVPDPTFGTEGFLVDTEYGNLAFNDIEYQYDGSVTVAGATENPGGTRFFAGRFLRNGERDAEFNGGFGAIGIDIDAQTNFDEGVAMAFHSNRIVVVGSSQRSDPVDFDYSVAALIRDRIFHDGVEGLD